MHIHNNKIIINNYFPVNLQNNLKKYMLYRIEDDNISITDTNNINTNNNNNSNNNNNAQENGENDSKSKTELSPMSIVFHFKLRLYKAQFELIRWNVQRAKKEVKSALEIYQKQLKDFPPGSIGDDPLPDNTTGLFLKANFSILSSG